eukprot:14591778-Alexandrium_andersonii.AAC.1
MSSKTLSTEASKEAHPHCGGQKWTSASGPVHRHGKATNSLRLATRRFDTARWSGDGMLVPTLSSK